MKLFFIAKSLLPLWFVITILCGLIYVAVHQNFRSFANDPQIQIAEDTAKVLDSGGSIDTFTKDKVDIALSLAPFTIVYNKSGTVTYSSAKLHGSDPVLPQAVLQGTSNKGERRFTWQPEPGVRIAAVIVPYNDGFVLAGRSLREIEKRESILFWEVGFTYGVSLIGIFFLVFFFAFVFPYKKRST